MGMSMNVYIGVMLYFPKVSMPIMNVTYKTPQGFLTPHKFDPNTGEKNIEEVVMTTGYVKPKTYHEDMFDAGFESEDDFYFPECATEDVFIPNNYGGNDKSFGEFDYQGQGFASLEDIDPVSEVLKFKKRYAKQIKFYASKYPHMEIRFGVLTHY